MKSEFLQPAIDGSYVDVTLRREYTLNGVKSSAVRMREPTVSDQLVAGEMKGSDALKEVQILANLCGLAPDDLKALGSPDYARLQKAYTSFFDQ